MIMLEVFLNFVYQLPFDIFLEKNNDIEKNNDLILKLTKILGLCKFWVIVPDNDSVTQYKYINDFKKVYALKLIFKVAMISLINI